MSDNPKLIKNGGEGTGIGKFLRSIGKDDILNAASVVTSFATGNIAGGINAIKKLVDADAEISPEQTAQANRIIELDYADILDARDLQKVALQQEHLLPKMFVYYISIAVFIFSAVIVLLLFFIEIPDKNRDVVNFILGVVIGTGLTQIFQYFFGSSQGSKDKSEEIQKIRR